LPRTTEIFRMVLLAGTALSLAAILVAFTTGKIDTTFAGIPFRMTSLDRALALLIVCGIPLVWLTPSIRTAIANRSALLFYSAMAAVIAALCFGPTVRVGNDVLLSSTPYR